MDASAGFRYQPLRDATLCATALPGLSNEPEPRVSAPYCRGWRLSHSPPPYVEELPLPAPPYRPRKYSLLILDIESFDCGADQGLHGAVARLRRKFVMPVFGRLREGSDADRLAFRDALANAGREFLSQEDRIGTRAREVLTIRPHLASDWLRWYRLHREIGPRQEDAVRALVTTSNPISAERVLGAPNISARSARRKLADALLPPPAAWARANRLLLALLALQRDPELDIYHVATAIGYSSSEAFSNAVFRYFAHGASKGRRLLGLERRFREFDRRYSRLRS